MGVASRLTALLRRPEERSTSFDPWATMLFNGNVYPLGLLNTSQPGQKQEEPDGSFVSFASAYRTNGVVFACMLARLSLFSEARFQFRAMTKGRPGDLFGDASLRILERPWVGGTTGDLLGRAIAHADLAGNAFITRRPGNRLKLLRPDWVDIVLGSPNSDADSNAIDAEVMGYVYHPGGKHSGVEPEFLLREQVAHFAPVPDPLAHFRGMSWLSPIVREIMADSAASAHKLAYFENSATPNLVLKRPDALNAAAFKEWVALTKESHQGTSNAYKTFFLANGADATVIGSNLQQMDFKVTQGAGETRIASAAGIHPVVVGLSEGMQGASLNSGNFASARRLVGDRTLRPLWRNMAGSLETIVPAPQGAMLWYDDRDIAFLREDQKDAAEIQQIKAATIRTYVDAGFTASTAVKAVEAGDPGLLKHSGLFSVQLQAPGSTKMPAGEVPGEIPVGDGTAPETLPKGVVSTKPTASPPKRSEADNLLDVVRAMSARAPSPIHVDSPVTIEAGAVQTHITTPDVRVDSPVTIERGAFQVDSPVSVEPAQITFEAPPPANVTVNVPEQEPPVVNITEGAITVEAPHPAEITVNVPERDAPVVNVTLPTPKPTTKRVKRDTAGRITEVSEE